MRGTLFQKPLEFKLHIDGESWRQGDPITGALTVKNHDASSVALDGTHVALAHGSFKDVRAKAEDAFEIYSSLPLIQSTSVAGGSEVSMDWQFSTDRNCPITDKSSSLFILYGRGKSTPQLGQLELAIQPYKVIEDFLYRFKTDFRFVEKTKKAGKGTVEVKLVPPAGQTFTTLDHVMLSFCFEKEAMQVRYSFVVKKIEATASSFDVTKAKKELEQSFASEQLRDERFERAIKEALTLVEAKILF